MWLVATVLNSTALESSPVDELQCGSWSLGGNTPQDKNQGNYVESWTAGLPTEVSPIKLWKTGKSLAFWSFLPSNLVLLFYSRQLVMAFPKVAATSLPGQFGPDTPRAPGDRAYGPHQQVQAGPLPMPTSAGSID